MKTTTKKPNGNKTVSPVLCPHSDVCAAPERQAEMMANVDQLGTSMGMILESQEQLSTRLSRVHDELLAHVKVMTDCNEYIVSALRRMGGEDA
jgi:hypothetical protein